MNVPMNFVLVYEETEPGMVVLWFVRVTWQPVTKFVPDMVIGSELVLNPEVGVIVVSVGVGLITVNTFRRVAFEPSRFRTVRLYSPIGKPVNGRLQVTLVVPVTVPVTVLFEVPFVMITVAPDLKFEPLIISGTVRVFTPEAGEKVVITGIVGGSIRLKPFSFVAFGPPGLITARS